MRGIPIRIEIGPKDASNNTCVIAKRNDYTKQTVSLDEIDVKVEETLEMIHKEMFLKASQHLQDKTYTVDTMKDLEEKLDQGGFVKAPWCENLDCELKVKEELQATTRCLCQDQITNQKCVCCGKDAKTYVYFARAY